MVSNVTRNSSSVPFSSCWNILKKPYKLDIFVEIFHNIQIFCRTLNIEISTIVLNVYFFLEPEI